MNKKILVALGGNALGNTPTEQKKTVKITASAIAGLVNEGYKIIVCHGNGPQVGMINLAMSAGAEVNDKVPYMPFAECGAMSQGYIGYHLQNALENEFIKEKIENPVVSLVSQVMVDAEDPAFSNPTKPIGDFYSEEEAKKLEEEKGFVMKEDAGRGYRRVIASPKPVDIVEKRAITSLYNSGCVVVAAGGGGIPVIMENDEYVGVDAVIDKDFSSAKLAELVDSDVLVILTAVEKVAINFGKENQEDLDHLTVEEAEKYIGEDQFAKGSMLPKIEAALEFVTSKNGRKAVITSLENAKEALSGKTGTWIG
ncbi:carbamate kinase [uncultured Anaerococcus sp.]|uniref:carbamate kinase n=1 Tax=uncultured Anaerococcus sp. TaxID=293428 RepID=UPI0028897EFB|nr:carbamate kinase [uncultured Anaerococcus sp.]